MAVGNGICFGTGPPAGGFDGVATGVAVDVAGVGVSGSAVAVAGAGEFAPVQASARTNAARPAAAITLTIWTP